MRPFVNLMQTFSITFEGGAFQTLIYILLNRECLVINKVFYFIRHVFAGKWEVICCNLIT